MTLIPLGSNTALADTIGNRVDRLIISSCFVRGNRVSVCRPVMRVCPACRRLLGADARQCPSDGAAAEAVELLPEGTRLGAYRIERVIGAGGMGFVYEAIHELLNRRSAIKMLRPELTTN